jgi:cell division protein YceG involved in septum cleavage
MFKGRKKTWVALFVLILLINLGTLGFFWMNHLHESRMLVGPQLKERIAEELQFDEAQKEVFELLVKDHQMRSQQIRLEIEQAKKEYYQIGGRSKGSLNALMTLKNAYGKLDELNYQHFEQIRGICRGDQIKKFEALVQKILSSGNFGFQGPRPKINP